MAGTGLSVHEMKATEGDGGGGREGSHCATAAMVTIMRTTTVWLGGQQLYGGVDGDGCARVATSAAV